MRDINGRFINQHELKYLRTNKGRKKVGVCNCCKTNTIPKNRFYCDNCRDWIESVRTRQQTKLQTLKSKTRKYKNIFNGFDPGNILQMINSFKKYKSSADYYRKKCERILKAYNELAQKTGIKVFIFKMQRNTVVINPPETGVAANEHLKERPIECEVSNY